MRPPSSCVRTDRARDLLDPKNDLVFKMLFTSRKELLLDMVSGVLGRFVRDLDVTNPTIPGDLSADKGIILDIRAVLADDSHLDLEMQNRLPADLAGRLLFYATREYGQHLRRGEEYHLLKPTASIVWLTKPLFPSIPHLHSIFELRDRATGTRYNDHLTLHVLQLPNLTRSAPSIPTTGYTASVHRWARFLTAGTRAGYEQLASEHPIMALAKETLELLSMDPETYRLAREREDSVLLYEMSLRASEARGRAGVLLKQLELRFGPVPEDVRVHVERARPRQFDVWTERVLTAASLEEVFAL